MLWKRGSLTPELADLVFTFLPLDLSVADENDILVYWKGPTYKTCDARYIGRDVRDCHPEQSMACLEEILREFKAGTKDVAEGWEQKGDKVKRTRYFALRDQRRRVQRHPRSERRRDQRPRAGGRAGSPRLVTRARARS